MHFSHSLLKILKERKKQPVSGLFRSERQIVICNLLFNILFLLPCLVLPPVTGKASRVKHPRKIGEILISLPNMYLML